MTSTLLQDYLPKIGAESFTGFISVRELRETHLHDVPRRPGVYAVGLRALRPPVFLDRSCGGHFKQRDPTEPRADLEKRWMGSCPLLYLGCTGGSHSRATLVTRLRQLVEFGSGKPVGHQGGRRLWQLAGAQELLVAWMPITGREPRDVKRELLERVRDRHGRLPFANCVA